MSLIFRRTVIACNLLILFSLSLLPYGISNNDSSYIHTNYTYAQRGVELRADNAARSIGLETAEDVADRVESEQAERVALTGTNTAYDEFADSPAGCSNGSWGILSNLNPANWLFQCIPQAILYFASKALIFSATVFDVMLFFSIQSEYLRLDVISNVWEDMRDIANIAFIFGLIYISFLYILNRDSSKGRALFIRLIIIALLLNFSLFAGKVIVDAGNITALTFYNAITAPSVTAQNSAVINAIDSGVEVDENSIQSISGAVVQAFNPVRMVGKTVFEEWTEELGEPWFKVELAFVLLLFSLISVLTAIELIMAAFFFVSRLIWLILLLIISPLAFVSYFLPVGDNGLKKWFSLILLRSFCIVPYIFALWAMLLITDATGSAEAQIDGSSKDFIILTVLVQFILVYVILKLARKYTVKMCEEGGPSVSGFLTSATKVVGGAALAVGTGGAGLLARKAIGGRAYKWAKSAEVADLASSEKGTRGRRRAQLKLFAGEKIQDWGFGTGKGYAKKTDEVSDREVKRRDRITNNLKKLTDEEGNKVFTHKQARVRAGDMPVNGIMAAVVGGLTEGVQEGQDKFKAKTKDEEEKQSKATAILESRALLGAQTALNKQKLQESAPDALQAIGNSNAKTGKEAMELPEVQKFFAMLATAISPDSQEYKDLQKEYEQGADNYVNDVDEKGLLNTTDTIVDSGTQALDSRIRTAQNMSAAQLQNVLDESAQRQIELADTFAENVSANLDSEVLDLGGMPTDGGDDSSSDEWDDLNKVSNRTQKEVIDEQRRALQEEKEQRDWQQKNDKEDDASQDKLFRLTKAEFDELESLISQSASNESYRTDSVINELQNKFKNIPNKVDFNVLQTAAPDQFKSTLQDALSKGTQIKSENNT